jgi:predicted DNA-binding transcriptional regulator YafY
MRADRLLSILMLLQTRGTITAQILAQELEVSERTIYRDIESLSTAGIPVYTERGPGGGCALLESYRTNLTGLTTDEVQALFMLSIPPPLVQLGVHHELKTALLKLAVSLPAAQRQKEEFSQDQLSQSRIYLDSSWWFQADENVPFLPVIHQALRQERTVAIQYRLQFGAEAQRTISPLGLVAKTNIWHLVGMWDGLIRVYRVSRITAVEILDEVVQRPVGFNLASFWKKWTADYEESRPEFSVTARVAPNLLSDLTRYFGDRTAKLAPFDQTRAIPDHQGWLTITLAFEDFQTARDRILGLGRAIEVLEPEALRLSVIDFATQIVQFYGEHSS